MNEAWVTSAWMVWFLGWIREPQVIWMFVTAYLYIVGCLMFVGLSKLKTGEAILLSAIWPGFVPVVLMLHVFGSLEKEEKI